MSSWSLGVIVKHGLGDFVIEGCEGTAQVPFNLEESCRELDAAYEAVLKERDKLEEDSRFYRREWESACERAKYAQKERDEARAELDDLKSYLPQVPTQPYEKELARKLTIAREALEAIASVDMPSISDKTAWIVITESICLLARQTFAKLGGEK